MNVVLTCSCKPMVEPARGDILSDQVERAPASLPAPIVSVRSGKTISKHDMCQPGE